jgi:hypothetical protein
MTDSPSPEWPDPTYHLGQRDHLHALGAVISAYNQLEFSFFLLFSRYIKAQGSLRIFVLLSNHNRIELMEKALDEAELNPPVRETVQHFIKGFGTLTDARNFLAHSHTILNDPAQQHLTFGKGSRRDPGDWSFAHMKLEDLRRIADEIHVFQVFGSNIDKWLAARAQASAMRELSFGDPRRVYTPSLPEKPPLPNKLRSVPHHIPE